MSSQLRLSAYSAFATICAASALSGVFADNDWIIPVVVGVLLVSGSCALIRHTALPSMLEPITAAVAVLCWITLEYARTSAHVGFVPGPKAFRALGSAARNGFTDIHRLPAPVPTHAGLVLLAVIGVAAIALVVDLLAVTLRRAALAGLPLLALFTVCAATGRHGVGVIPFVIAAIGYLSLLYADNRENVNRWGAAVGAGRRARPAPAWSADAVPGQASSSQSRRIGATAVSLAIVVPLFIPGLHAGFDKHGNGGNGTGGNVTTFNPIVSVAADLNSVANTPVLSYVSSAKNPGYLRLTSLDLFNGVTFSSPVLKATASSSPSEQLPVKPPEGKEVDTRIKVGANPALRWLPVPTTLLGTNVGNEWRYDPTTATVFSATTTTSNLNYTTRSVPNNPSPHALATAPRPDKSLADDLSLPDGLARVKKLTRQITATATNNYDAALDIQRFFRGGHRFHYDATIPADHSPDPLVNFLFNTRRGFCQQFATSMAVMARQYGIPARVAVGFTRGVAQPNGSWLVKTHDAHAWPELWFEGFGWLAFEPTPRADGQAVIPAYARHLPASAASRAGNHHNTTGARPHPTLSPPAKALPRQAAGIAAARRSAAHHHYVHRSYLWVLFVVALVALLVPGVTRIVTRQRRRRQLRTPDLAAAAAWAELRDTAIDLGVAWNDGHTPRQTAGDLSAEIGARHGMDAELHRLVRAEEVSRYAPIADRDVDDLRPDLSAVQSALKQSRSGWQRLRSVTMPRSSVNMLRTEVARTTVVRDHLERAIRHISDSIKVRLGHRPAAQR